MLLHICTCLRTCVGMYVPLPAYTPHIRCNFPVKLAALKYAHQLEIEKRAQQHRELLQVVMHDKAEENMLVVKQEQRDHAAIVQAILDECERKRAADEARHQQEMLDLRQQFVGQKSTQQVTTETVIETTTKQWKSFHDQPQTLRASSVTGSSISKPTATVFRQGEGSQAIVTYISEENDEVGRMLVQHLATPECLGIRLYHCHKRGTYFMKKDDLCTPELFIKLESDTLKAFHKEWVDLDAFIRQHFGLQVLSCNGKRSSSLILRQEGCRLTVGGSITDINVVDLDSFWSDI
mmetsp:Transcript_136627/g.237219  ORF Transcript_136627/g.237219 Transcript_136627/m.237219 type:complete len:293 (-) Transcript_136627:1283-2161(-)